MAVAPMKRVRVIGYIPVRDQVVSALQQAGVLDIVAGDEAVLDASELSEDEREQLARTEELHAKAQFVRDFLTRYHVNETAFGSFVSEKVHLDYDIFLRLKADDAFEALYGECEGIADALAHIDRERLRLRTLIEELEPWETLPLQISAWTGTAHVALVTGTVSASRGEALREALREATPEVTVEELGPAGSRQAWVVMAHKSVLPLVRAVLATSDFVDASFPGLADYPAEEISLSRTRLAEMGAEEVRLKEMASRLSADHFHQTFALVEALASDESAMKVREEFGQTDRTFVIGGWTPEECVPELDHALDALASSIDITYTDPGPEDSPPVLLRNPRLLQPFETLTDLYGRPAYHEIDPTPLLAPFFWAFFGIAIGDVGYGTLLVLVPQIIKRKLDVAPGVKRFMDLLSLCGVAAIIFGVMTASYFAIDAKYLPRALTSLALFDPLQELQTFLLLTIALGLTQVVVGVIVAAVDSWRKGDWQSAVFDQLSTLFLFGCVALAVVVPSIADKVLILGIGFTFLFKGHVWEALPAAVDASWRDRILARVVLAVLVAIILGLAFNPGRTVMNALFIALVVSVVISTAARKAGVAVLAGAYEVYGLSGFLGDVLSYTRLAALGLSGFLVGMVFNILGGMVVGGAIGMFDKGVGGVIGGIAVIVLGIAVFVVGHVFNVVINLLGAFVHPARLQFVEFFSKFYEGGGKPFSPFSMSTNRLVFGAGDGPRREGGRAS